MIAKTFDALRPTPQMVADAAGKRILGAVIDRIAHNIRVDSRFAWAMASACGKGGFLVERTAYYKAAMWLVQ